MTAKKSRRHPEVLTAIMPPLPTKTKLQLPQLFNNLTNISRNRDASNISEDPKTAPTPK